MSRKQRLFILAEVEYSRAVELCVTYLSDGLNRNPRSAVTPIHDTPFDKSLLIGASSPPTEEQICQEPQFFVEIARVDFKSHEGLLEGCRRIRKNGNVLPYWVTDWLVKLQLGEIDPPPSDNRAKTDVVGGLAYHAIAALVLLAGMPATRNAELGLQSTLPHKRSASDVVADAFSKIRSESQLPRNFDTVKNIWNHRKSQRTFVPSEYRKFAAENPTGIWSALEREIEKGKAK
jgi:hypothetical protein